MKTIPSLFTASIAALTLAALPLACSNYSSDSPSGGGGSSGTSSSAGGGGNSSESSSSSGGGGGASATSSSSSSSPQGGSSTADGGSSSSSSSSASGGSTTPAGGSSSSSRAGGTTGNGGGSTAPVSSSASIGGATSTGGTSRPGGSTTSGGASGGTTAASSSSAPPALALPCDVLSKTSGNKCVTAHSTVRVIVSGYTGPLYQLCKGTANNGPNSCKGTTQDVGSKDGYADAAAQDTFCSGATCTITKIYDQSGMKNDLEPAPKGNVCAADKPADAKGLPTTINGHAAYGVLIKPGMGYRGGCSGCTVKQGAGMAKGDEPTTQYWVTSQKDLVDSCCFDYGNAETTSNDDGNGTMETLYFGGGVIWGTGSGGKPGPWMMADLENGLYAGWESKQDKNISTNKPLKYDFVTGVLLGDTKDKNSGKGRFAIYGGNAQSGTLQTMWDGIRPEKPGYVPMTKQGSIILGIGGDNSCSGGGRFYEGAVVSGPVVSKETVDALQAAIVAAKYEK